MKCKTAEHQMALAVGEDLTPAETQELQQHLQGCSKCQQTYQQHQRGFAVLLHSRANEARSKRDSVWPMLASQLQARGSGAQRGEFNGWIAALAVTAASVLLFVFSQDDSVSTAMHPQRGSMFEDTMVSVPSQFSGNAAPEFGQDEVRIKRPYNPGPRLMPDQP